MCSTMVYNAQLHKALMYNLTVNDLSRVVCTQISTDIKPFLYINSLTNDKILAKSKLKAFADNKINVTENLKFVFWKDRKHCGKSRKCW